VPAVPADLIAEAKANIEPRLRAANHFYTWMEIVVGDDSAAHNQIFYHLCPIFTEFSLKKVQIVISRFAVRKVFPSVN
jgi:hypothetical protein